MTVLDKIRLVVEDLEAQRKLGHDCNWAEVQTLAARLRSLADQLDELAWANMYPEDEAA